MCVCFRIAIVLVFVSDIAADRETCREDHIDPAAAQSTPWLLQESPKYVGLAGQTPILFERVKGEKIKNGSLV